MSNNIEYLRVPNKNGVFTSINIILLENEFFEKYVQTDNSELTVSAFHGCLKLNKKSNKQMFCLQFTDYETKNGDVTYYCAQSDFEFFDGDEKKIQQLSIEKWLDIIERSNDVVSFHVLIN